MTPMAKCRNAGRIARIKRPMFTNLQLALKTLMQNRLQALLTLSGMSIGVAMVVIVSGLGLGAQRQIEAQIESAGPTLITIRSGNFQPIGITTAGQQDSSGGELAEGFSGEDNYGDISYEQNAAMLAARQRATAPRMSKVRSPALPLGKKEITLLEDSIADIRAIAASVAGNLTLDPTPNNPVRIARLYGYEVDWPDMQGWELVAGELIDEQAHLQAQAVAMVPQEVADRYWQGTEAVGQSLFIGGETYEIVAVVATGESEQSSLIVPTVYVPLPVAQRLLQAENFDQIHVRSASVQKTTEVAENIRAAMRKLRQLPDDTVDDFSIQTQSLSALPSLGTDPRLARAVHANIQQFELASWEEMATSLRQAGRTFTYLLSSAAAVSLLVGGIGVMNIMLVSVTSRTREIGLRMAVGARMNDVLSQFMVEAITLAALGGLLGLAIGTVVLFLAQNFLYWTMAISPTMLLLAISVAAITGLVFGYGPARRAASLDPVIALKAE